MSETATVKRGRKPAHKVTYRQEDSPLLTAWPVDFDQAKHTPLVPEDFAPEVEYIYWDNRAEVYRKRMQDAEREADLCRKFGSKEQRNKVSQMEKLKSQLEALKAELGDLV